MRCPRCDFEQPEGTECVACGVVFEKLSSVRPQAQPPRAAAVPPPVPEKRGTPMLPWLLVLGALGVILYLLLDRPSSEPSARSPAAKPADNQVAFIGAEEEELPPGVRDLRAQLAEAVAAENDIEEARRATVYLETCWGSGSGFFISSDCRIVTNRHVVELDPAMVAALEADLQQADQILENTRRVIEQRKRDFDRYCTDCTDEDYDRYVGNLEAAYETWEQKVQDREFEIGDLGGWSDPVVVLADGTELIGRIEELNDDHDLAFLKIDDARCPFLRPSSRERTPLGDRVFTIGSPQGIQNVVTAGIFSGLVEVEGRTMIQTDAPINSGNSGGALADRQGRVIGINDSIITGTSGSSGTGNVGIGFAIPIDIAKAVADRIVAGQSTVPGFLGVEGADATGSRAGAAITSVQAGSPAAQAGVTTDDVVTAVDGRKVSSMIDLAAAVRTKQPGEKVTLTVVRGGDERTVEVTLGTKG